MSETSREIEQILKRAIQFEEQARDFYRGAVGMVKQPHVQEMLRDLASEEIKHKERLETLLAGNTEALVSVQKRGQIQDLKLAEYLVAPDLAEHASFQDVLVVAMHREKSSHEFYSAMASIAGQPATKDLFEFLAQEELAHKNKVETLYDEVVYQDN
jgi:rubrerythrin